MSEEWIINIRDMRSFLPDMVKCCNAFCYQQEEIDHAYNTVIESWWDKNCLQAGLQLKQCGKELGNFRDYLVEQVKKIHRVCDYRATAYLEDASIDLPSFNQFNISIKEEPSMQSENIVTTVDALERFAAELENYIISIRKDVVHLNREYDAIGRSWRDSQYRAFGRALEEFEDKMRFQDRNLNIILAFVRKKIIIMKNDPANQ